MPTADPTHTVYLADARHMPELGDESIHLVVTSPPYWCIKDYGTKEQIGRNQPYAEYLDDLRRVLAECHRVLHPGCRAAVNIGDQYLRAKEHGRYRIQPIPADLIGIGMELGFDFMGSIIWRKISTTNPSGGCALMGSIYYPRDGHITYEHEYILLFRKQGKPPTVDPEAKERSRLTLEQRSAWFRGVWDDIAPVRRGEHEAMFPVELPRRLIRMYSCWGETVLDPFVGSGTTCEAAAAEGRSSVGYEVNPEYEELIRRRAPVQFLRREA